MSDQPASRPQTRSRRAFLQSSSAALLGTAVSAPLAAGAIHHGGTETLKVGLIGCGGRGTGAAVNAMRADENVELTALCDAFGDRLENCRRRLTTSLGSKMAVDDDHCFTGFDGYKQLINSGVDVVLLCTPPHFRPAQLRAAVDAGKHVFCEKPVAVDAPGVRSVLESTRLAKQKNLNLVSGLCWRYDVGVRETMKRIQDGAIGDVIAIQENYLTGTLWHRGRKPDWSEMEYQMRNWLYFTWLSGDHIVEQHIHSLDKALWLNQDELPEKCVGMGGRQARTEAKWGHIYDHFAVCYEWPSGIKTFSYTRQMGNCAADTEDYVLGTKGRARVIRHVIEGDNAWRFRGSKPSMYDVEHQELFAAIRSGNPINNGEYMSYSTLMAIMGREACYTGKTITREMALNSKQKLGPAVYEWGEVKMPPVAIPGRTDFS